MQMNLHAYAANERELPGANHAVARGGRRRDGRQKPAADPHLRCSANTPRLCRGNLAELDMDGAELAQVPGPIIAGIGWRDVLPRGAGPDFPFRWPDVLPRGAGPDFPFERDVVA